MHAERETALAPAGSETNSCAPAGGKEARKNSCAPAGGKEGIKLPRIIVCTRREGQLLRLREAKQTLRQPELDNF